MFAYNGYHFEPERNLKPNEKTNISTVTKHLRSDRELGMCDYHVGWKRHGYSHKAFYAASDNDPCDIFRCIENDKLYIPCEHELFEFI